MKIKNLATILGLSALRFNSLYGQNISYDNFILNYNKKNIQDKMFVKTK